MARSDRRSARRDWSRLPRRSPPRPTWPGSTPSAASWLCRRSRWRMRPPSVLTALLLLGAALPATAAASPRSYPTGSNAAALVHNFWDLVAQGDDDRRATRPKPQAIPPAPASGPAVDLSDLSQPTALESRLKPALTPKD